jgi:hypothetical protein
MNHNFLSISLPLLFLILISIHINILSKQFISFFISLIPFLPLFFSFHFICSFFPIFPLHISIFHQQTSPTALSSSSSSPFSPPNNTRKLRWDGARSWCRVAPRRWLEAMHRATAGSSDKKFPLGGAKGPILFLTWWHGRWLFLTRQRGWWLFPTWHGSGARWHMATARVSRHRASATGDDGRGGVASGEAGVGAGGSTGGGRCIRKFHPLRLSI